MADTCSGLHDPYEDQLAAARYRAERDMLAQAMERVADDIEWTFLGFEGAEDAPAMRWAGEFRAALGSLHAPGFQKSRKVATSLTSHSDASDVTMSAHDLLPEAERDAIAWVREHGGLEEVRKRLMPEGMEWPRFEDGEPVRIGDEVVDEAEEFVYRVSEIAFSDGYGTCLRYEDQRDGNLYNFIDGLESACCNGAPRGLRPAVPLS